MVFAVILSAAIAIIVFYVVWHLRKYIRILRLSQQFDGPPALPIIGHANLFVGLKPEDVCPLMQQLMLEYRKTLKIWFGPELNLFMSDVKDIEVLLGSTLLLTKSSEYDLMRNWLNDGLLLSKGPKWFKRRRALTPAFHFQILNCFIEIFDRQSRIFIEKLRDYTAQSAVVDLSYLLNLITLDIICESSMGVSVDAQMNVDSEYVKAVKTVATVIHKRIFDIKYRFDLIYKFTQLARDEAKALATIHGFTEKIIVQRREELLKSQMGEHEGEKITWEEREIGLKKRMAFLDILLQLEIDGKPLSNLEIREEVDTFMFAGHDTTSSALLFFFYNIASYPECQRKCFEEIVSVLGTDCASSIDAEALNKLHYVELCLRETLRLYPSVPVLGRRVTEEFEINGKIIPAGCNIGVSSLFLGRLEELFPEPNSFKPERFDVNACTTEKLSPYAYIPFSAGPRNCIGQKFAMLEMKTIVANVLRNYQVLCVDDSKEEPILIGEIILRTRDPIMFKLKERIY